MAGLGESPVVNDPTANPAARPRQQLSAAHVSQGACSGHRSDVEHTLHTEINACEEGWLLAHNAVRHDLHNMAAAIKVVKQQVDGGQALQPWQCLAFRAVARDLCHHVRLWGWHQERLLLPGLERRVRLPPNAREGHRAALAALECVRDVCCHVLRAGMDPEPCKASVGCLNATFEGFRSLMLHHLHEEEQAVLPLVRKHLSAGEAAELQRAVLSDLKPRDMAWLLRPLADGHKTAAMERLKVPGLSQLLVIQPAARKDAHVYIRMYRELAAGERVAGTQAGGGGGGGRRLMRCFLSCTS